MQNRTRRDHKLIHLVSEYEAMSETGNLTYLDEKTYVQLITYYEGEFLIDKALEVVHMAMEQFQYRAEFYITKAKLLLRAKRKSEALETLAEAAIISPSENEITILRARCIGGSEGLKMIENIKRYAGRSERCEILFCEAVIYEDSKQYKKMFAALKSLLLLNPTYLEALEKLFICVDLTKSYEQSIAFHNQLLEINPYNFLAWYNLGHAYACSGEYEQAINAMEYSLIVNQDFELAYLECADTCIQVKNYVKALSIYEEANNHFGPDSEILLQMAICNLNLDNLLSAKANLFSALRLDAYSDEVYYYLGLCYLKEKAPHSAKSAFKKAVKLESGKEEYYEGLAMAHIQLGENAKAAVFYGTATEIAPEQERLWYQFTSLLVKLGRIDEALDALDIAEEEAWGPELLYCRAVCLSLVGRKKEALEILDEALIDNFSMHDKLFDLDPSLKFDKDILSIINYYEGEAKM